LPEKVERGPEEGQKGGKRETGKRWKREKRGAEGDSSKK
jgi:hypothetical protein